MISFGILFSIIILTVYLALAYESEAIALLLYGEVLFFVVSFFALLLRRFTVKGSIAVPVGISETGKENLVRITVTNKGLFRINRAKALIVVEDMLRGSAKRYFLKLSEIPRGESSFTQGISFQSAGNYEIVLRKLRVYDWTGLLYRDVPVRCSAGVQVLPHLYEVPVRLTMAVKNFYGEADVYDEHKPGHDNSELFQVRSYQKGDRLQNVHWKLTAKQDDLVVKERSLPKSCPVLLFLDVLPERRSKRKNAVPYLEIAASLSYSLVDARCPHYVVWYDSEEMDIVRFRVDDEESLFYFIGMLMKIKWEQPKEDLIRRYQEKHRQEIYVWALSLDDELVLKKGEDELARFSEENLEQSLQQVELIL